MAQAQLDADFGERFRHGFLHHRRDALRVVLDRAVERGQLPDGLSPDTVADVVFGVIWYRLPSTDVLTVVADLAELAQVRRLAAEVKDSTDGLDALAALRPASSPCTGWPSGRLAPRPQVLRPHPRGQGQRPGVRRRRSP